MTPKLQNITSQYTRFTNDQVLTADNLNVLIDYFEDQDKLSRVMLNGTGIVCGFNVDYNNGVLQVSKGCGITSDGDLIDFKQLQQEGFITNDDLIRFSYCTRFEDENANYDSFKNSREKIELWELLPEKHPRKRSYAIGSISSLSNMIVLLYLENYPQDPKLCNAVDCNNQGIPEIKKHHFLLVSEAHARSIIQSDTTYKKHAVLHAYLQVPEINNQRFILNSSLSFDTQSVQKLFTYYTTSMDVRKRLKRGITVIFDQFSPFLNKKIENKRDEILQLIDKHLDISNTDIPEDIQYRADLLKDLIATYNEIKADLLQLNTECRPATGAFPKHLLLGKVSPLKISDNFRHSFYKTGNTPQIENHVQSFNSLLLRFYLMLNNFNTQAETVTIIPSNDTLNLSKQSIPFYYTLTDELLECWDYKKTVRLAQNTNLCASTALLSTVDHIQKPLKYNFDKFNIFKIEGLIGTSASKAVTEINQLSKNYGLDFTCYVFDLEKDDHELFRFLSTHKVIEHAGGVPIGGTLILLKAGDKIIADFSLKYKADFKLEDHWGRIMQVSYPWISSINYLNNLSRSLHGTQSRRKLMPKYYRLLISKYRINSTMLIDEPVEIKIKLSDLLKRRMFAVVDELNAQFPTGLVFGFSQSSKKLTIKHLLHDTFTISIKDVTFNAEAPLYTYTQDAIKRNNTVYQTKDVAQVEIKPHHKGFYQYLHEQYNLPNKDDDYGKNTDKWARWNELLQKLRSNDLFTQKEILRYPNGDKSKLPSSIISTLNSIKNYIKEAADSKAEVYLSGEWVNGTWVNSEMIKHYNKNRNNTHDDIVNYIKLRQQLMMKRGVSRLTVFVTGLTEEQIRPVQDEYKQSTDFYLGMPVGEHFIKI